MRAKREIGLDNPKISYIKVNVDASNMAMVARELFFGTISKCWFGHKLFGIDLHKMQALVIRNSIHLALGHLKVIIKTDARDVV